MRNDIPVTTGTVGSSLQDISARIISLKWNLTLGIWLVKMAVSTNQMPKIWVTVLYDIDPRMGVTREGHYRYVVAYYTVLLEVIRCDSDRHNSHLADWHTRFPPSRTMTSSTFSTTEMVSKQPSFKPSSNFGLTLGQRRRQWPNVSPTLEQYWTNVSCLLWHTFESMPNQCWPNIFDVVHWIHHHHSAIIFPLYKVHLRRTSFDGYFSFW